MHGKDWLSFITNMKKHILYWKTNFAEQVRNVAFYTCHHGMQGNQKVVLDLIQRTDDVDSEKLLFFQIHCVVTLQDRDKNVLLINFKNLTKSFSSWYKKIRKVSTQGERSLLKIPKKSAFPVSMKRASLRHNKSQHSKPCHSFINFSPYYDFLKHPGKTE